MNETIPQADDLLYGKSASPDSVALVHSTGDGKKVETSYKDLYQLVESFERFLEEKGLSEGDRLVLVSPNTPVLMASIIACWRLRALATPVDFRMTPGEIANVSDKLNSKLVLVSKAYKELENIKSTLESSEKRIEVLALESCKPEELSENSSKNGNRKESTNNDLAYEALVILTSGTTGEPKGAVHELQSLVENLTELGQIAELSSNMNVLIPLPVSHIFGLEVACIGLLYGATVVFSLPDKKDFLESINQYTPEVLAGVPTLYAGLLGAPDGAVDLSKSKILLSGGAPLPVSLAQDFEKKFSKRLNNGYGSTESKIIALNLNGPVESVGKPVPSTKILILDEQGNELAEGKDGEILIQSDILMKRYLDKPEKTKEVLTDKGYKTGDMGHLQDGYLFISGRSKEMIVVAGNKVFPIEVEEALREADIVEDVAITGEEHGRLGQIVKATVVVADDKLSAALESGDDEEKAKAREEILSQLKNYSKDHLKRELRPMKWDLRPKSNPLPLTRTGKVDKKAL